jgi:hypothetical protein
MKALHSFLNNPMKAEREMEEDIPVKLIKANF